MSLPFLLIAVLTVAAATAAMTLRNLVHCSLALVLAFAGLAAAYLQLGAQFVGFAQILVYIGAVAILIVFAVLLTRGGEGKEKEVFSRSWIWGVLVAVVVFGTLAWAVKNSAVSQHEAAPKADATVMQIGDALMTRFVLPLEVLGLLLTAAMIGAVIIALKEGPDTVKLQDAGQGADEVGSPSASHRPASTPGGHP